MLHLRRVMTPRAVPDLIDVEQELFEFPQRVHVSQDCVRAAFDELYWLQERVIYNKEVQTMEVQEGPAMLSEAEIRERIQHEREALEAEHAAREKELEQEIVMLDKEIEEEIRGKLVLLEVELDTHECTEMTEEEKFSIFSAPEFLDFVEQSTKVVQRALNDSYDYVRDYTIGAESGM